MSSNEKDAFDVLDFWWGLKPQKWFTVDTELDNEIGERFGALHTKAANGGYEEWETAPHTALALILLLDQFSRNIHRGAARAFACDERALRLAGQSVSRGFDRAFPVPHRNFFYMPFQHAESVEVQERSVDLFRQLGDHNSYFYALIHLDAIRRFGRFPHRNKALGRTTTPEEQAYLDTKGFSA